MIDVRVEADSVSPYTGKRLTTFVLTYPRYIHSEALTHRAFSRNSASSRAIPVQTMLRNIQDRPVIPITWGRNRRGMQADEPVDPDMALLAEEAWLQAMQSAIGYAKRLSELGIHKMWANRIVEPWMHITTVLSGTEWDNFFELRCDQAAQPEFQALACAIREAMEASTPREAWEHLPFTTEEERADTSRADNDHINYLLKIATGRIARVSYLTHDGKRDPQADVDLHDRLLVDRHMSPFEHCAFALVARSINDPGCRNFVGWRQYRSLVEDFTSVSE